MARSVHNKSVLLLFLVFMIASAGFIWLSNRAADENKNKASDIYRSESFKLSFQVPNNVIVFEESGRIKLKTIDSEIEINKLAVNFREVDEFIKNQEEQNRLNEEYSGQETLGNYKTKYIIVSGDTRQKIYFFEHEGTTFRVSAYGEILFDDLAPLISSFDFDSN